jgi:hypothetical protein
VCTRAAAPCHGLQTYGSAPLPCRVALPSRAAKRAPFSSSMVAAAGGGGGSSLVRASHILVKHAGSRRPSSWRQSVITISLDEAVAKLRGLREAIVSGRERFEDVARRESDCACVPSGRGGGGRGGGGGLVRVGRSNTTAEEGWGGGGADACGGSCTPTTRGREGACTPRRLVSGGRGGLLVQSTSMADRHTPSRATPPSCHYAQSSDPAAPPWASRGPNPRVPRTTQASCIDPPPPPSSPARVHHSIASRGAESPPLPPRRRRSAAKAGDLGEFGPGQMQAPFEHATYALRVGDLSDIVQTDSGVHIILRTK